MSELEITFRFLLAVLACYRLTGMIVYDDGPAGIFARLREWAGVYDLGENLQPRTGMGRFFECPHCMGVWVALVVTVGVFWERPLYELPLFWLAIAGLQSYIEGRN